MEQIKKLKAEDFFPLLQSERRRQIMVEGKSLKLLNKILDQTDRLAPMGDDEMRTFWIEVPGERCEPAWFRIRTCRVYNGYIGLDILEHRDMAYTVFYKDDRRGITSSDYWNKFLSMFLDDITHLIDYIVENEDDYNAYVDARLPKQLREGKIRRRKLVELLPDYKLNVELPDVARQALTALIGDRTPTVGKMTIREFCKWYRIAYYAFMGTEESAESAKMSDMEFYNTRSVCCRGVFDNYEFDFDSEKDYLEFAKDHYSEIGLSRCDIAGVHIAPDQWKIGVGGSYSSSTGPVLNIVAALYKAGAPLYLYNPVRYLAALDETDYFAVKPNIYHDYLNSNDDDCGGSVNLPFTDEITEDSSGEDSLWTMKKLTEVIAETQWKPLLSVRKAPSA